MTLSRLVRILTAFLFTLLCIGFVGRETQAQATRTWVSGTGDDANPCSRQAPCKTFAGAISKTYVHGEINALDPGGYGTVTITKSITIGSTTNFYWSPDGKTLTTRNITNTPEGSSSSIRIWDVESGASQNQLSNNHLHLSLRISEWIVSRFGDDLKGEGSLTGTVEVHTVSKLDGCAVKQKRVFYSPVLNPASVRKFRGLSSPAFEDLPVGGVFVFWVGDGDDPTPISDKVTITVQPNYNPPITLQLRA